MKPTIATPSSSARFEGRTVAVVGAGAGMGEATARRLAAEGAKVALCDVDEEAARGVALDIGPRAAHYALDVRDPEAVPNVIARIEAELGALEGLALTSGVFEARPFFDSTEELWSRLFAVNVFGAVRVLRAAGERMRARARGSIVVVASQSAKVVRLDQAAYGSSKAALTYATKALGLELAPHGVRVNVVQPGVTETSLTARIWGQAKDHAKQTHVEGTLTRYRAPIPLGKVGQPNEVAAVIAFLLSEDANHVTMAELLVDGGGAFIA